MKTSPERLTRPLPHLQARQQTDVAWRAADALLRGAACPAWRREFRPLACELPLGFFFIVHAALDALGNGEAGSSRDIELATPRNVEVRHAVCHRNDHLRAQNDHRKRDRHLPPPSDRSKTSGSAVRSRSAAYRKTGLDATGMSCRQPTQGARDGKADPVRLRSATALRPRWRLPGGWPRTGTRYGARSRR